MTLQNRLAHLIDPGYAELTGDLDRANEETRMLRASLETVVDVLRDETISIRSPAAMIARLQESGYDTGMLDLMVSQLGWDQIGGMGEGAAQERTTAVEQAIRLFRYSPLAQWSIWLWTGWGLGDKVTVTLKNTAARKVWDEFVTAERNEPVLSEDTVHELSDWLQVKGNRFLVFFTSTKKVNAGQTTIRVMDQAEVTPVANPLDKLDTWFYKREFIGGTLNQAMYYPDHRTLIGEGNLVDKRWALLLEAKIVTSSDKRADLMQPGTAVSVLHIAHNRKDEQSVWGWPITTAAGAWVKGHKQFAEAHLGVALAIAQFVRRSKVKGGSRAVASVIGQIASTLSSSNYTDGNPPGAAGSWHVENEASTTKELPLNTGASDAKADNEMFMSQAGLGMGLLPVSFGLDTARWATAVEMDKAQAMLFERYQRFWAAQFRKIVRLVLLLASKYGPSTFTDKDTTAEISTDSFSLSDYPAVSKAVADQVKNMLEPYASLIPDDTTKALLSKLWSLSLDALGVDTKDLTSEDAFGVGLEPEPAPVPPPMPPPPGGEPAPDDEDAEPEEESAFIQTLQVALQNLEAGDITPDQFAEFMMAQIGEVYSEHGETGRSGSADG